MPAMNPSGSAATTNSVSPTGRNASGPSVRYPDPHSTNTVLTISSTVSVSARSSAVMYGLLGVLPEVVVGVADPHDRRSSRSRPLDRSSRLGVGPPADGADLGDEADGRPRRPAGSGLLEAVTDERGRRRPHPAAGTWTSSSSCRHSTMRASRSARRARTVTAHILNSSAAAPWTRALRAYRPRAAARRRASRSLTSLALVVPMRIEPAADGAHVAPDLALDIGVVQVAHRHRVGRLQAPQGLGAVAGRLPVHRPEHGDLRRRPVDARAARRRGRTGRRRWSPGPGGGRRTRRRGRVARSVRGRHARRRDRVRRRRRRRRSAGMLCNPAVAVIRPGRAVRSPSTARASARRTPTCSSSQS